MKITIDTQNDSDEDIKKTIKFLQDLVDSDTKVLEEVNTESGKKSSILDDSTEKKTENYEPMGISWY